MSDAVMPRVQIARSLHSEFGRVTQNWARMAEEERAQWLKRADRLIAMLAASTPVGGWEEPVAWLRDYHLGHDDNPCLGLAQPDDANAFPVYAAPPPASVSTDKGSRPQEAVPSEGPDAEVLALRTALKALLTACYSADAGDGLPDEIDGSLLDAGEAALDLQFPVIWTPEQVAMLEARQAAPMSHPYTCGGNRSDALHKAQAEEDGDDDTGILIPTVRGWICPACDYRQFWSHETGRPTPQPADGCSSNEGASAAHTPGPWVARRMHTGGFDIFDPRNRDVVTVYGGGVETESREANARLIAAAPCMALTLAEIACKADLAAAACDDEGRASGFRIIAADARTAIAKATILPQTEEGS